jgi:prepilin-type N-terminal cleavage/methylation domain-containing protein
MVKKGFTLVEVVVVVGVIAMLAGVMIIMLDNSRKTSRDEKRKIDLQTIQAGMEEFNSHCRTYLSTDSYYHRFDPARFPQPPTLSGYQWVADLRGYKTCIPSNVFLDPIPEDPQKPDRIYRYTRVSTGQGYVLCAALEIPPTTPMDVSQCGGRCGNYDCNYIIESIKK